jgi:hypothetical protein
MGNVFSQKACVEELYASFNLPFSRARNFTETADTMVSWA